MKANDDDYTVVRHGALAVLLIDRDQPISENERGYWSAEHVQARYAVAVTNAEGDEIVVDPGFSYKYNPKYAPTHDEALARDILESVALDLSYENDYWPKGNDAGELAVCVLRYVRDMGMDIWEDDAKVADFVSGVQKQASLYPNLVTFGEKASVDRAIRELREHQEA